MLFSPEPSSYHAGALGTNARAGAVQLLSVHVDPPPDSAYAAGADAVVCLTLGNGADQPDTLESASGPVAGKTEIRWDDNCDGRYTTVGQLVPETKGRSLEEIQRDVGGHDEPATSSS